MKESGYLDTPYLGHQGTISWPHNLSMRLLPLPLLPSHSQKFLPGWLLCFFSYFPDSTSSLYPCEVGPSLLQLKKLSQSYSHLLAQPKTATETQSLGHTCSERKQKVIQLDIKLFPRHLSLIEHSTSQFRDKYMNSKF